MSRTTEQIQNLRNLIRANRESPNSLRMSVYGTHACGTAYCAIGNYAYRRDLQSFLKIDIPNLFYADGAIACYDDKKVRDHFGLHEDEIRRFFSPYALATRETVAEKCHTPQQVADYIETYLLESDNDFGAI